MTAPSLEARTRTRRRAFACGVLGAVALAAIIGIARAGLGTGYSGIYSAGFEASEFRPCDDTTAVWWAAPATADAWAPVQAALRATAGPPPRFFLRLRGRVEGPGRYGHMGAYTHQLIATQVGEARPLRATDCRR